MAITAPPPFQTARLGLRLVERGDLPGLLQINRSDEVTRFLPYASWATLADAEAWFSFTQTRHAEGSALQFVLIERSSAEVVGSCLLFHFDEPAGRAELGYVLGHRHWGRGVMREALEGLIGHVFGAMGLRRLEAEVDPRNLPSEGLLRRLGFSREGLLRQRRAGKGEIRDAALYGLLRSEWPPAANAGRAPARPLMVLIAGPYRSGTGDDPRLIEKNVEAMVAMALRLFRAGHLPMLGEWLALPLIRQAGSARIGDAAFDEIFHPVSRRLVAQCDACLRIGGPSAGADEMVALARQHGKAVYFDANDIPPAGVAALPASAHL